MTARGDVGYIYRPKGWRARGPAVNGKVERIGAFYTKEEAWDALSAWWMVQALRALGDSTEE